MRQLSVRAKQIIVLFFVAILGSVASIIHGVYFDMDFTQIERLTVEGLMFTIIVLFPTLLFIEWIFEWNNIARVKRLEERIKKLERKINSRKIRK